MSLHYYLRGLGTYLPEHIITNAELLTKIDSTDEWIESRTGILERRKLAVDENVSDAGINASKIALKEAGVEADELTHVFVATCTPEYLCPSVACIVAGKLGCAQSAIAMDFNAACSGFVYGQSMIKAILDSQPSAKILFICAEAFTRRMNWEDRNTCILFGDGAGAMIYTSEQNDSIAQTLDVICKSDGTLYDLITMGGGTTKEYTSKQTTVSDDFFLQMQGRDVFKHAVRNMADVCREILENNKLTIDNIDLLIPHQANMRIIEALGSRLKVDMEKVFSNVQYYGNTSAASIPLAIQDARAQKVIKKGTLVLCTTVGSGLTWGASLMQF